jgi:hypothetical protein
MSTVTTPAEEKQGRQARERLFQIRFVIEGVSYAVIPLTDTDPRVAVKAYRMKRTDARGKVAASYDVRLSPEGHVTCECKGFLRWGRCKHVRTLQAAGMLGGGG